MAMVIARGAASSEFPEMLVRAGQRASGAFLTDYTDEPAFDTACVLEGIVTVWEWALERGDAERAQR